LTLTTLGGGRCQTEPITLSVIVFLQFTKKEVSFSKNTNTNFQQASQTQTGLQFASIQRSALLVKAMPQ
jgi:hypothetical protein